MGYLNLIFQSQIMREKIWVPCVCVYSPRLDKKISWGEEWERGATYYWETLSINQRTIVFLQHEETVYNLLTSRISNKLYFSLLSFER